MNKLEEDLGRLLANKLVTAMPGATVNVKTGGMITGLEDVLDSDDCARLKQHYQKQNITIPVRFGGVDRNARNRAIMRRIGEGVTTNIVAAEFGLTGRQITNIRRSYT